MEINPACGFCGEVNTNEENIYCTSCGKSFTGIKRTTADYDPYNPNWKPWKEPVHLTSTKKQSKKETQKTKEKKNLKIKRKQERK